MPRGRPKKQTAEIEILPPEENSQPLQQVREVKHTAQWIEQRPVEETTEGEGEEFEDDASEDRPKRRVKNAREELRKKLRAQGISPGTNLRLYIEKYLHSDSNTGGSYAETEFCTKYETTEDHILNKDYIDVARRWGAGKYRITIRMQNRIADAFDERISATPVGPIVQSVNPNDPNSPQVIVQSDGQQAYQPMSMKDMMQAQRESLKEELEFRRLLMESYGLSPNQLTSQQQPKSEEEVLTTAILKQPEVIENVVGSVLKRFGASGGKDDEPWYADVVRDMVKSGQAVQVVQVMIDRIFNGVSSLFPGRQNNGQAQVGDPQQQANQNPQPPEQMYQGQIDQNAGEQQAHGLSLTQANEQAAIQSGTSQQITPAEQALATVIADCQKKIPPQVTFTNLMTFADAVNDQAPAYSIDGWIEYFAKMPIEAALEFVKTQPNGEQIATLEWAKDYTEQLQKLIRESLQEGEG